MCQLQRFYSFITVSAIKSQIFSDGSIIMISISDHHRDKFDHYQDDNHDTYCGHKQEVVSIFVVSSHQNHVGLGCHVYLCVSCHWDDDILAALVESVVHGGTCSVLI